MKKIVISLFVLAVAGMASAAILPSGCTGLWLFDNSSNLGLATIGTDLTTNAYYTGGPGGGALNTWPHTYATVTGGMTANGGGDYVNEYTIAMDIMMPAGSDYRSLYQTADLPEKNDGDLWVWVPDGQIGVGSQYSATGVVTTNTWYRVTIAADLGTSYKVYVNGTQVLDMTGTAVDDRWSLYTTAFSVFADNDGEDGAVICNTLGYWNRTLTGTEVASMGNAFTVLEIPEPATIAVLALGGLLIRRKK